MKKIIILVLTATCVLSGIFFYKAQYQKDDDLDYTQLGLELHTLEDDQTQENFTPEDHINMLRNRFSLRWIIMKWDNYFENNQLILALNEYLKAYRENPQDDQIITKIADVYFETKNFKKAEEFYAFIQRRNELQTEKLILSLFYQINFEDYEEIKENVQKIKNLRLPVEQQFYYMNSLNCSVNLHECKKYFHSFFNKHPNISFWKLNNIKEAFITFDNFQTEHLYYKDALMIGAFFRDKMYSLSNLLWTKILQEKSDYQALLLMTGKWYYELWQLSNAQSSLLQYYQLNPQDITIAYLLWNIYFRQRDYTSSNLYYNVALRNNFEPKIDLQRKLIYNYYLLGDTRSMLNIFSYLLDEPNANIEDFSLWIYHAILTKRVSNASVWSKRGIEKFSGQNGTEIFYWYLWWIERESGNLQNAENFIKQWLALNPRNPLLTLNYGYTEKAKGNYPLAIIYFKRTITFNGEWEFWELANKEIASLESKIP